MKEETKYINTGLHRYNPFVWILWAMLITLPVGIYGTLNDTAYTLDDTMLVSFMFGIVMWTVMFTFFPMTKEEIEKRLASHS